MKVGVTNYVLLVIFFLGSFSLFCMVFPPLHQYYDQMQGSVGPGQGFGGGGAGARTGISQTTSDLEEFVEHLNETTGGPSWLGPLAQVFWMFERLQEWLDGIVRQVQIMILAVSVVDTHLGFPLLSGILGIMLGGLIFCIIRMLLWGGS